MDTMPPPRTPAQKRAAAKAEREEKAAAKAEAARVAALPVEERNRLYQEGVAARQAHLYATDPAYRAHIDAQRAADEVTRAQREADKAAREARTAAQVAADEASVAGQAQADADAHAAWRAAGYRETDSRDPGRAHDEGADDITTVR